MTDLQKQMQLFGKKLRTAAMWCTDGYYSDDTDRAVNRAKREVWEEIASIIDDTFEVDSDLTAEEQTKTRYGW